MSSDLIKDLSVISTIPESYLQKLVDKSIDCICNDAYESFVESNDITKIDIGIGTLYIVVNDDNEATYKFIPSDLLETKLVETFENNVSPLETKLESSLVSKILNVYKELL